MSLKESILSREFVADWLRQVPEFMDKLGIEDRPDLAARLRWLGSGGRADVVYLGERDGIKQVLKITNDPSQGLMSRVAMMDEPLGVVPIYTVVETSIPGRGGFSLPDLPPKDMAPIEVTRTWGVVEKFAVPISTLHDLGPVLIAEEAASDLVQRYFEARDAYDSGYRIDNPQTEDWRLLYAAALEWVSEACVRIGSAPTVDLHEGNWGVDPDTGDLLLIDLGQCYAPVEHAP